MHTEEIRFSVLNDLKELAKEADKLAELIPQNTILDDYFALWKNTISKIKTCTSVKDLEFPPSIKTAIYGEQRIAKKLIVGITETERAHVHGEKNVVTINKTTDLKAEENERTIYASNESCKKTNQEIPLPEISAPKAENANILVKIVPQEVSDASQKLMVTPIMNRTFNRLINNTLTLNSTSSYNSNQKSNINEENDLRMTRSGSKQKLQNADANTSHMQTRSGSKRKSSKSDKSNKKPKREINNSAVSISATKAVKPKQPLKRNPLKPLTQLSVENKSKVSAVIKPTMKQNTSLVISKEKQMMEEIQKKEEKANENLRKVLAERQLKAEETKKKRTEKMQKTQQKRLMIKKEKEERFEKKENDLKKAQTNVLKENVKRLVLKVENKELIDQHMKTNSSETSYTPKQKNTHGGIVLKTPVRDLSSRESETYELTPVPDSTSYEFSDDDERKPSGKPIPSWAQGVQLRLALTHQFYNPSDTDQIFGTFIEPPNLVEIFRVQKKRYLKRTSSAVWNRTPDHSFSYS